MSETFDPVRAGIRIINWTRDYFAAQDPELTAVIGISGGKDSTICAKVLCEAIGPDRVLGVLMPDGEQADLDDAKRVVKLLGIQSALVNINEIRAKMLAGILYAKDPFTMREQNRYITSDMRINTPPRIRMALLYAMAQSLPFDGRVANTCNASEDYIGYSTKYGDSAGDFAPLQNYTVTELLDIGLNYLHLPEDLVLKTPADGLCQKSDEEKIGFRYHDLDVYIRTGACPDETVKARIDRMHAANLHKLRPMPSCPYVAGEPAA